jgi:hypothetical protein
MRPKLTLSCSTVWNVKENCHQFPDLNPLYYDVSVTVAERSNACIVFARSEAGIVGLNPTQGIDIWYVYVFILCLCCPVFR